MAAPGLKHPALGVGEAGVVGPGERGEGSFEGFQARGGLLSGGAEARRAPRRRRRLGRPRIAQKRLPGGPVLHGPVAREEGGRLRGAQGMAGDDPAEVHLLVLPERAEGEGRGEGQPAMVQEETQRRGEFACEGEAALNPGALLPQQLADSREG